MTITTEGNFINLNHKSGVSAQVSLIGATVTSWKDSKGEEKLFLSKSSVLDGSKAIRGGIPIAFPVFGKPPVEGPYKDLPQHGYARITKWVHESNKLDNDDGVSVGFSLNSPPGYPACRLYYTVTLTQHQLTSTLHVKNLSSSSNLQFQALLHTYHKANPHTVTVEGLKGSSYLDKVNNNAKEVESKDFIKTDKFTDSVYISTNDNLKLSNGISIRKHNFPDTVLWNPSVSFVTPRYIINILNFFNRKQHQICQICMKTVGMSSFVLNQATLMNLNN